MARIYRADGSNVDLCRRAAVESGKAIARPGTPGMELADALPPLGAASLDSGLLLSGGSAAARGMRVGNVQIRWGAFYRTRLDEHLRSLGVTTLSFAGCNFPNCGDG
jgi:nicotinamidase-related amidase